MIRVRNNSQAAATLIGIGCVSTLVSYGLKWLIGDHPAHEITYLIK